MLRKTGELLIELGACTAQQLKEAQSNKVIFGGRLGTNLLELGAVTEEQLAHVLGVRYGVRSTFGEIEPESAVRGLVTPELVDRTEIIPWKLEGRRLLVLTCDPTDLRALDEVAFSTGKKVQPVVVAESRIWALMRSVYHLDRQLRGIDLEHGKGETPPRSSPAVEATDGAAGLDLMSEAQFAALYDVEAAPPPTPPPAPKPGARPLAPQVPLSRPEPAPVEVPEILLSAEDEIPTVVPVRAPPPPAPPPAPPPEPGPLSFAEAAFLLEGVEDREAIARTVLRYARSKFKRSVLLTVRAGAADGWEALGEGLVPKLVRRVRVKLDGPGVFQIVAKSCAHFLGPMQKTEANIRFLRALGGGAPKSVFLLPIVVLGRVVNILYADNGRGGHVDADLGELLILSTKITKSYDFLLARVK